jgi:hypothetical protein
VSKHDAHTPATLAAAGLLLATAFEAATANRYWQGASGAWTNAADSVFTYVVSNLEVQIRCGALTSLKDRLTGQTYVLAADPDYTNVLDRIGCLPSGTCIPDTIEHGGCG